MKKLSAFILLITMLVGLVSCSDDNQEKTDESVIEDQLIGTWSGAIEVPDTPLNIIIEFHKQDELAGSISIPIQNVSEYPLTGLSFEEGIYFRMDLPGQKIRFEGDWVDDGRIEGTFTQQGQSFPFYLERGSLANDGHEEEDATFLSVETAYGELEGELLSPDSEGPHPIALIIPGSGPTDRNGNSAAMPGENDSLKLLAEGLAEQGIASLRYSKRGAAENQDAVIAERDIRFENFVNDAKAWIDLLHEDERFSDVHIIGHSQGSLVGMLAAQEAGADRIISIAGAGKPMDEVLLEQLQDQLSGDLLEEAENILAKLKQGEVVGEVSTELQNVFRPDIQPFLASWIAYNPAEVIAQLEQPVLIIQGGRDLQVPKAHAAYLKHAQSGAETMIISKMNHVLKEAPEDPTGNMQTYSDPELPLADGLMQGIVEFLTK
ncbi:alpha/beta hydrolase [Tenuibacillus multivorans]|nr:alpha/beta hydrolase [Tenuibacillus multivorans]